MPLLVGARVLQAAGGALLVPASQLLVMAAFPPEQRMKVIGAMAGVAALASALGPVLGGLIVDLGGWRLVFLVNLPIGLAALVLGRRMPAPSPGTLAARPDLLGSVLAVAAVGTLALGAVQGPVWGWGDPRTIAAFAASALLTPLLVWRCARHPAPVLELVAVPGPLVQRGQPRRAAAGDELLRPRAGQLALPDAGLGLLGPARRPGDRARAAGQRGGGVRWRRATPIGSIRAASSCRAR